MTEKRYIVMVDDNFHYMDESERTNHGEFSTYEEAVAACKKIVDEDFEDMLKQGIAAEDLSSKWAMFGSDPFIIDDVTKDRFSARNYVSSIVSLKRFKEIAG